jgi:glucose/arabinose dehydrogenase
MKPAAARAIGLSIAFVFSLLLASCGGGDSTTEASTADPSGDSRQSALAISWTALATEHQSFTVNGAQIVRYGSGTSWIEKMVTGSGQCSNAFFGKDPLVGTLKSCQLQVSSDAGWTRIAVEKQSFTVTGTRIVRFGVDTRWKQKSVTGTGQCTNAFFGGDPAVKVIKSCEVQTTTTTDTTPPVATLTAPANLASNLAGTVTLSATATDNVGVSSVEFQVDGVQVGSTDTAAPYSASVDTNLYASGQHIVRARARDAAGNLSNWSSATVQFGGTRNQPSGITNNESWITGLDSATAIAQAPDGRMFVTQKAGQLRVVKNGALLATPFLSLTVDSSGERGLIGVALHPNFASNRYLYVYHTTTENGAHNRISRFTASASNGDVVAAGSELVIADLPTLSSATNHNGGAMHFGNDGKLYVAVGDNANGAQAPDLNLPFGKMLRFNDDGSIPNDNPFCTTAATLRCAVWARGLRNPYTFAVRPSDGRIHINDVGENTWEEINLGVAGANYGWPSTEGATTASGVTGPLFTYDHDASSAVGGFFSGCAIIGGAFYPTTGPFPAAYRGSYFFTDFCTPTIGRVDLANGNVAYAFGRITGSPVGMLTGADGALYVLTQTGIVRFGAQ